MIRSAGMRTLWTLWTIWTLRSAWGVAGQLKASASRAREDDVEDKRSASREYVGGNWPRYDAAVLGFRNYWYPVLLSRQVRGRPRAITVCGERIVLVRDRGRLYALHDRCPHRGVPLSAGRREFP